MSLKSSNLQTYHYKHAISSIYLDLRCIILLVGPKEILIDTVPVASIMVYSGSRNSRKAWM